jgi:hypothetical protein
MIRRIAVHDHIFANHLIDTSAKNFPPKKFFSFLRGLLLAQTSGIRKLVSVQGVRSRRRLEAGR